MRAILQVSDYCLCHPQRGSTLHYPVRVCEVSFARYAVVPRSRVSAPALFAGVFLCRCGTIRQLRPAGCCCRLAAVCCVPGVDRYCTATPAGACLRVTVRVKVPRCTDGDIRSACDTTRRDCGGLRPVVGATQQYLPTRFTCGGLFPVRYRPWSCRIVNDC